MRWHLTKLIIAVVSLLGILTGIAQADEPLRAGIIGLDTSHAVAFTKLLNDPDKKGPLAEVVVVAAYPGGSPDIPFSCQKLPEYTAALEKMGVEMCDSIEEMLDKVDVVFLESVDGRPHLEQVKPVFKAKKPVFIDKPIAGTLADAIKIFQLAKQYDVPCFSASSLRYGSGIQKMRNDPPVGEVIGCAAYSPCEYEEHHPDFFWYGVHGVETLFTIMGKDCDTVTRIQTPDTDLAVGVWKDGRIGSFRGTRTGPHAYGATVYGSKSIGPSGGYEGYEPLVVEICKFFKTGVAPVSPEETLAIFAFMEAADESKRQGGAPVSLESVMKKAEAAAAKMP